MGTGVNASAAPRAGTSPWLRRSVAAILFILSLSTYIAHMAPSVVPGDPGEYQLIAARWGIGHPPGYGFYALVGNLFTHSVPIGTFAWRANLLAACCGATIVTLTYGLILMLLDSDAARTSTNARTHDRRRCVSAALGALVLAAGLDLWEHAIHANAHILTATLAVLSLFCLVRWWKTGHGRWLYIFALIAGISPVQHPLLIFAFPAYAIFILAVHPRIWNDRPTLLKAIGCALLGLSAYLYYPLRCAIGAPPAPGPDDMNTWSGFVRVVTAQGLRGNLLGFSWREILQRLWDVRVPLGLQYSLPTLLLAMAGLGSLWARRWRAALLLSGYVACVVLVTVNILQDEMAYLLGPMAVVGVCTGVGAELLWQWSDAYSQRAWVGATAIGLLYLLPLHAGFINHTRMDLSEFRAADEWLARMEDRFVGHGERAALLTEWEQMTTVYYYAAVEGRTWDEDDLRFVPISAGTATPFLDAVEANFSRGPVYLTTYRPEVMSRYRLLPEGELWRAVASWPRELPEGVNPVHIMAEGRFEIVGWRLNKERARPGDVLLLDLYMRMPAPEGVAAQRYYLPWAQLGETRYRFTTDSRFNTPWWQAGEIVGERFELPVPWTCAPGSYPLRVGVQLLGSDGRDLQLQGGSTLQSLTTLTIVDGWRPPTRKLERALGNLHGEILLRGASVNGHRVPEHGPLPLHPGRELRVVLKWEALRPVKENYTVFVQLLDAALRVRAQRDTPPLGGSAPTWLWFPRWRRGMRITDTYILHPPPDLPPGTYPLVVGMYGFATRKRVQVVRPNGDVEGDWITLAHMQVGQ